MLLGTVGVGDRTNRCRLKKRSSFVFKLYKHRCILMHIGSLFCVLVFSLEYINQSKSFISLIMVILFHKTNILFW